MLHGPGTPAIVTCTSGSVSHPIETPYFDEHALDRVGAWGA